MNRISADTQYVDVQKGVAPTLPSSIAAAGTRGMRLLSRLAARGDEGCRRVGLPADAAERAAFIRRFVARQTRRAGLGLGVSVLVLPLGLGAASAQSSEFVYASTLPAVTDVVLNHDGSVTLTLRTGAKITVQPEDVRHLPDGHIAVAADAVPDLMLIPGSETFLLAGLGGAVAALAGAASGGSVLPAPTDGIVVDGYIVGATVFRDIIQNGQLDPGEPSTITTAGGAFTLAHTSDPASLTAPIISIDGFDEVTGATISGAWSAPAGATRISPISTLVQALVETGIPEAEAKTKVATWFELESDVDPLLADPIALADAGQINALKAAAQVQSVISSAVALAMQTAGSTWADAEATKVSKAAAVSILREIANAAEEDDAAGAAAKALGDQAAVTSVITESVAGANAERAADVGAAIAKVNTALATKSVSQTAVAVQVNETVKQIEQLQTLSQKVVVSKIETDEEGIATVVDEEIADLQVQPYRPILTENRFVTNDSATSVILTGEGLPGSTVQIVMQDDGTTIGTGTALVAGDGTWQTTIAFATPAAEGLYNVRLSATHPEFAPSAARDNPFLIGEIASFPSFTADEGNDYFFYVTDLSVLETDGSVSIGRGTISLILPEGSSESLRYFYPESDTAFAAGVASLPEGTRLLLDGTTLRDLDLADVGVRVIKYEWPQDWQSDAPSGPVQTSVVLTVFDRATGLDYIGQLGLPDSGFTAIPDFQTRDEAEDWVNAATASKVPFGTPLSPSTDIPLDEIDAFLQAIGRDQTDWTSFVGTALPGSSISLTVGGEAFGSTARAFADGRWVIAGQDTEAAPVDFDQVLAWRVTDPTNGVDLYQIGTDEIDYFDPIANARNIIVTEDNNDQIDLSGLGITEDEWDAILADDTKVLEVETSVLGGDPVTSTVVEVNDTTFIIFAGLAEFDASTVVGFVGGNT